MSFRYFLRASARAHCPIVGGRHYLAIWLSTMYGHHCAVPANALPEASRAAHEPTLACLQLLKAHIMTSLQPKSNPELNVPWRTVTSSKAVSELVTTHAFDTG